MKKLYYLISIAGLFMVLILSACKQTSQQVTTHLYQCPMPADSFFSDKPGKCPKCGMELIPVKNDSVLVPASIKQAPVQQVKAYACPMHPQVQSDTAGYCTICGMKLEKAKPISEPKLVSLNTLLKPANQQVIANIPMVHLVSREEDIEMESYGFIAYDTRQTGVIAANFSGRIEKLYIKYRYQKIEKGQHLMDIYSPEMVTAEDNLLFLLKNDPENSLLVNSAKQKLLLLGMSSEQINAVMKAGKPALTIAVYSNYSGHIHESNGLAMNSTQPASMNQAAVTTESLSVKEGDYLQKGQSIFSVFNPDNAWVLLNIFTGQAALVKKGNQVRIKPEADPAKDFIARIDYIEPMYRQGNKTLTARVYFNNSRYRLPIGSQVKASIFAGNRSANWLPQEAILSLGLDNIVFVRTGESFQARKIATGISSRHLVQVLHGLEKNEAVAANAQYLVDSESFIKTN